MLVMVEMEDCWWDTTHSRIAEGDTVKNWEVIFKGSYGGNLFAIL
jgi:hypothetical protein